ncbi:hypothetical protein Peur_015645 [Populus x canadensis]
MGDFNAIRNQSDRLGGSTTWAGTMDRLDTCIREAKVDDLRYSGMHYTWSNQCPENLIMRKLDRVLVNEKWNLNFPLSEARFLPSGMSDHSPMVVKVIGNDQNIKKPFRFFDMWMDHDEFMPLVKKVWDQNSGGCPMYQLCCKLRKLKQELKLFNMAHFSNISDRCYGRWLACSHLLFYVSVIIVNLGLLCELLSDEIITNKGSMRSVI